MNLEKIFELVTELAIKDKVVPIMDKIWERKIDKHWKIVVNGYNETKELCGIEIPAYHIYVEFNGFPAGLINPFDGIICAGKEANIERFIGALETAIEEVS